MVSLHGATAGLRAWTEAEEKTVKDMFADGFSDEAISQAIGRSVLAIRVRNNTMEWGLSRLPYNHTLELARSAVGVVRTGSKRQIATEVAGELGYTLEAILPPRRGSLAIARARQEVMLHLYATGRFSTPQIAAFLKRDNHTTVMHGIRAAAHRILAARREAQAA